MCALFDVSIAYLSNFVQFEYHVIMHQGSSNSDSREVEIHLINSKHALNVLFLICTMYI